MSAAQRLNGKGGITWHTAILLATMLGGFAVNLFLASRWTGRMDSRVEAIGSDMAGLKAKMDKVLTREEYEQRHADLTRRVENVERRVR